MDAACRGFAVADGSENVVGWTRDKRQMRSTNGTIHHARLYLVKKRNDMLSIHDGPVQRNGHAGNREKSTASRIRSAEAHHTGKFGMIKEAAALRALFRLNHCGSLQGGASYLSPRTCVGGHTGREVCGGNG